MRPMRPRKGSPGVMGISRTASSLESSVPSGLCCDVVLRIDRGSVCLFALCVGCDLAQNYTDPEGPRYANDYAPDPAATSALPKVKLVTFNIRFGEDIESAANELANRSDLAGADVVLLQEMHAPGTDTIAAALEQNYVYYPGSVQHGRDFGNAVLSRWPIVTDEKIILPHKSPTDGRIRIAVCATVRTPLGDVRACSVHTETPWLGPRARLEQAESVLLHVGESDLPTLAGGDFNTSDPGALAATVDLYESAGFTWASHDSGDTAGAFTLDSAFTRHFDALGSGTVSTEASDHRPQWVNLQFAQPR
jgi:endonuclease/exonuclease/phosphatase family metal-dependent hydrolase